MKVLLLSFYYKPDLCAGSFRMTALVEKLKTAFPKDTEFHLVTTMPNRYKTYRKGALEDEVDENVIIKRVRIPTHKSGFMDQAKSFYSYGLEVFKYTRSKDFDLVFATSSRLMTAFLGALISRRKKAPLYLDIRDLFVDTLESIFSPPKFMVLGPVFKWIERRSFNRAGKINIVSGGFEKYFVERYGHIPLKIVSNGIDDTFLQNSSSSNVSLSNYGNKIKVLYAGNIGEGQGLHKIIPPLAKKLSESHHFYVIGDGGRKSLLEASIEESQAKNVTLLPPVGRDELKAYYSQADVLFLHLNAYSAFEKVLPSKIFEYSVYPKPILAGVSGFSAKFLRNEVKSSYIFHPCDVSEAQKQINQISLSTEQRDGFVKKYKRDGLMSQLADDIYKFSRGDV